MLVSVSFIGTGNYTTAHHRWQNHTFQTDFVCDWIRTHFRPDRQFLFLTNEARNMHEKTLLTRGFAPEQLISVPNGAVEGEMWQLFETIGQCIDSGDTLILDVTHGFRSQPMLLLAATQYYRRTKNVEVLHTFYGTFDRKIHDTNPSSTFEVVDLNPFFDITDWAEASNAFVRHGRPGQLAALCAKDSSLKKTALSLHHLETAIRVSSMSLMLKAFREIKESAGRELKHLPQSHPLFPHVPTFNALLEKFEQAAFSSRQFALARYMFESNNVGLAAIALQEALISLVMEKGGLEQKRVKKSEERQPFSGWLSARSTRVAPETRENQTQAAEIIQSLPWCDQEFFENYKNLQRIRLTVAHTKPDPDGHSHTSAEKDITLVERLLNTYS
jgi:CRISPR-associated DxTHG motif protein